MANKELVSEKLAEVGYHFKGMLAGDGNEVTYEHESGDGLLTIDYLHETFFLTNCNKYLTGTVLEDTIMDLVTVEKVTEFVDMLSNMNLSIFDEPRQVMEELGFRELYI